MINEVTKLDPTTIEPLKLCSPKLEQLYIKGEYPEIILDDFVGKRIGIVGTRSASSAGLHDAKRIGYVAAKNDCVVVSGMALGIDGAAHVGALDGGGKTIAVLGSGVDVIYPPRHIGLSKRICGSGCLISEYHPGTSALAWHFPIRNRIIAALSDVLVVPEGTLKGGARITVDLALAMGKPVCVITGPRRSPASELPNALAKDGAIVITDPCDVLNELGMFSREYGWGDISEQTNDTDAALKKDELYQELAHRPLSAAEVSYMFGFNEAESIDRLNVLENAGLIYYSRGKYLVK